MNSTPKKKYTAELQMERSLARQNSGGAETTGHPIMAGSVDQQEILDAIESLRRDLTDNRPDQTNFAEDFKREVQEGSELRNELQALTAAIAETKQEIAGLRHPGASEDHIETMTNQLDAIVQATEGATNTILGAAEAIDGNIERMRTQASGEDEISLVEEVSDEVIKIFEACNFQDLTGQRITKVVNTLKFVEERVEMMMEILGGADAFKNLPLPDDTPADADQALLQGPQLDGTGVSQNDIDAMFD